MTFTQFVLYWLILGIILFPLQLFITAPYGRHTTKKWGPLISNKLGWLLMEIVSLGVFAWFFLGGEGIKSPVNWIFFGLYAGHYIYRSLIFPFLTKTKGKKIPFAIVLMAAAFNIVNGYTNGYYLGNMWTYEVSWLADHRFVIGIILFITGLGINTWADRKLIRLRKPGETGYKIPKGGLFERISCPNHFGEMIEWTGFAIMCWNLPAAAFAVWTITNLLPRALSHHRWYKEKFPEYPKDRKAIIPGIV